MARKVVMAFCGGLNTSLCLHWLRHHRGLKVIAFIANLGQGGDFEKMGELAIALGAQSAHYFDLREAFIYDYVLPAYKASAQSEVGYLLSTALSRPLLIRELVRIALEEGCHYISHGASEFSNDHVRFEMGVMALSSHLKVIAPNQEWLLETKEEKFRYAERHEIPMDENTPDFHEDVNIWGRRVEGGVIRDPYEEPPEEYYTLTRSLEQAPTQPLELELEFQNGLPNQINQRGVKTFHQMVRLLNRLGGRHGIGRMDVIENKLLGNKAREIYEAPGAKILHICHRALEEITLSQETLSFKDSVTRKYSELIYRGLWFSDLREALDAFFEKTQTYVTGKIRVRLYRGSCTVIGRKSKYSLYDGSIQLLNKDFMQIFVGPTLAEASQKRHK